MRIMDGVPKSNRQFTKCHSFNDENAYDGDYENALSFSMLLLSTAKFINYRLVFDFKVLVGYTILVVVLVLAYYESITCH